MGNLCFISEDEQFDYDAELLRSDKMYSRQVGDDDAKPENATLPRRHLDYTEGLMDEYEGVDTVWKAFQHAVEAFPQNNCLGTRLYHRAENGDVQRGTYEWITYQQAMDVAQKLGRGFRELGVEKGDPVGICSANRAEWTLTSLANSSQGFPTVALYDSLGENAIEYIVNHAETKIALVSKAKLKQVLNVLPRCPVLKTVVQYDPWRPTCDNSDDAVEPADRAHAEEHGVRLLGFTEVLELGEKSDAEADVPGRDDLAFIMYTSGTTGNPKGVMLTHNNVAAAAGAAKIIVPMGAHTRHISYLPLAHIFETMVQVAVFLNGGSIGFFSGNIKLLTDDMCELRPTIMAGVPRVYTKFYEKIMSGVSSAMCIKRNVVTNALISQSRRVRRGEPINEADDKKIFSKIREKLGLTECELIVTGAAPMPPYLMEFMRAVVNPKYGVLQGYGLTETAAGGCVTAVGDHTMGHVGPPVPACEIRLEDIPEMGYLHTDENPRGEICIRGPNIFRGYYKNDEATAGAIDPDGWFHTGDVGRWNTNGTLSIIDRKKNIFKLSQGEYIASEKIEQVYTKSVWVNQVFVYGNSYKPVIVAIIVPAAEPLIAFAKSKGWWDDDSPLFSESMRASFKAVVEEHREEITQEVMNSILEQSKEAKLKGFEKVKAVHLEGEVDELLTGFTVANDCLTPTFKLRRPFLVKRYMEQIKQMYTDLGEPPKPDERW